MNEGDGTRIEVPGGVTIRGDLAVPERARGVVIFAHGSGSGRLSPRNRLVAGVLNGAGIATLLLDLLTPQEEQTDRVSGRLRFDIALLAERLSTAADHVGPTLGLPLGYFGASTGAGAALVAAADRPESVRAVVSRGGRPDLAGERLAAVRAPTLLICGAEDPVVVRLNREAQRRMTATTDLVIVPRATHLFEEPGTLEEVARLASGWFTRHMTGLPS